MLYKRPPFNSAIGAYDLTTAPVKIFLGDFYDAAGLPGLPPGPITEDALLLEDDASGTEFLVLEDSGPFADELLLLEDA